MPKWFFSLWASFSACLRLRRTLNVRLGENTCAALPIKKIPHLRIANLNVILSMHEVSNAVSQSIPRVHFGCGQ
jgi:hypothetical protein